MLSPSEAQSCLLTLSRKESHREHLEDHQGVSERRNPACGDEIWLLCRFTGEPLRSEIRYQAQSCAVTHASAAVLCEWLSGLSLEALQERMEQVRAYLESSAESGIEWEQDWAQTEMQALGLFRTRPMRMKCVTLPWLALEDQVDKYYADSTCLKSDRSSTSETS